jgi:hypothetical protein
MAAEALDPTALRRRVPLGAVVFACTLLLGLLAVASLSELLLGSLAANRVRNSISGTGVVVQVSAEPAAKLLLGRADAVTVRIRDLRVGTGKAGDLVARAGRVDRLDVTVEGLALQGLRLSAASVRKRGDAMHAEATVTRTAIAAILPPGMRLGARPKAKDPLAFPASLSVLGRTIRATVRVRARQGRLVLEPSSPLGGLASLTLWADPRVSVDAIAGTALGNDRTAVSVTAHLT